MMEVLLGLGSNLGDREGNLQEALRHLRAGLEIRAISSFYETEPIGYLEQPPFVNAVCLGETDLPPSELLSLVKSIEAQMGRKPTFRYGPRVVDIDILSYGSQVLDTEELTVPHPRMAERAFVLVPLAEIAPEWEHPVLGKTAEELAAAVGHNGVRLLARAGG